MHVYTWQPVTEVDARVIEENQKALALIDHVCMQKMYKDAFALHCTVLARRIQLFHTLHIFLTRWGWLTTCSSLTM